MSSSTLTSPRTPRPTSTELDDPVDSATWVLPSTSSPTKTASISTGSSRNSVRRFFPSQQSSIGLSMSHLEWKLLQREHRPLVYQLLSHSSSSSRDKVASNHSSSRGSRTAMAKRLLVYPRLRTVHSFPQLSEPCSSSQHLRQREVVTEEVEAATGEGEAEVSKDSRKVKVTTATGTKVRSSSSNSNKSIESGRIGFGTHTRLCGPAVQAS